MKLDPKIVLLKCDPVQPRRERTSSSPGFSSGSRRRRPTGSASPTVQPCSGRRATSPRHGTKWVALNDGGGIFVGSVKLLNKYIHAVMVYKVQLVRDKIGEKSWDKVYVCRKK